MNDNIDILMTMFSIIGGVVGAVSIARFLYNSVTIPADFFESTKTKNDEKRKAGRDYIITQDGQPLEIIHDEILKRGG